MSSSSSVGAGSRVKKSSGRMTWHVLQARDASQAPSRSTLLAWASSRMVVPSVAVHGTRSPVGVTNVTLTSPSATWLLTINSRRCQSSLEASVKMVLKSISPPSCWLACCSSTKLVPFPEENEKWILGNFGPDNPPLGDFDEKRNKTKTSNKPPSGLRQYKRGLGERRTSPSESGEKDPLKA